MSEFNQYSWPPYRNDIIDFLSLAKDSNPIYGMFEVNVTKALEKLSAKEKMLNKEHSFTAYFIWCIAQAVKKNEGVQALKYKKSLVVFKDVDLSTMIEKTTAEGKKMPVPYIFRAAQNKSFEAINDEMLNAKNKSFEELSARRKKSTFYRMLPAFLRRAILKVALKTPEKRKHALGTFALTSLGMFVKNRRFWPVAISPYPTAISSGSIFTTIENGREQSYFCYTIIVDHNIIDGGPGARFAQDLVNILENAESL